MSATYLPSNLIVPNEKLLSNPNWIQSEAGTPVSAVFTEAVQNRLLVVIGRHPSAYRRTPSSLQDAGLVDHAASESSCVFRMEGFALQQCSGFQLEEFTLTLPVQNAEDAGSGRNLTDTLCGDYVDDAFANPRRFAPMATDMTIPLIVNGVMHSFNMANYLPHGQSVAYYTLGEVLQWLLDAWTNFMHNHIGDTSFYATIYTDSVSPRIFWSSTTYSLSQIRLAISDVADAGIPSFLSAIKSHLYILDTRTGDTSQEGEGYPVGDSMGILPRSNSGFQNNALSVSVHSSELTQFRKSDSIAPSDGSSLLGVMTLASPVSVRGSGMGVVYGSINIGGLVSPKISFDKTQTLTEFNVYLRAIDASGSTIMQISQTELRQWTCMLVFRCW